MLYGRLPTSRMSAGKRLKSYSSASEQCTVTRGGGNSLASRDARSRSSSITSSLPTRSSSGRVRAPSPGPISTMKSSWAGLMASTMRASTRGSCRKCCPNLLRGRCELNGELDGFDQAAGIGFAGPGEVERSAVVDRGAHERQAEGDVHALAEACVLEHRQSLVVIHGEHGVGVFHPVGNEQRVGRNRAACRDAFFHGLGDGRSDHLHVL